MPAGYCFKDFVFFFQNNNIILLGMGILADGFGLGLSNFDNYIRIFDRISILFLYNRFYDNLHDIHCTLGWPFSPYMLV